MQNTEQIVAKCLVIIPTYNEKENIVRMIKKVLSLSTDYSVLIIDDNSPDGTASLVNNLLPESNGRLFLEQRPGKFGLGTAYVKGFKWALQRDFEFICEMDADFSHNPDDLPKLVAACRNDGYDMAIGSRYICGVNVVNWPIQRVLLSYFASSFVRRVTGIPVRDTTAGFKCYRRRVLEAIDLNNIQFSGYAFQIEMKFLTWKMGFKIKEISIIFMDRTEGVSKMSSGIFKEAFVGVFTLRLQSLFKKYTPISKQVL